MGIFRNHNKRFKFYKYLFNRTVITLSNSIRSFFIVVNTICSSTLLYSCEIRLRISQIANQGISLYSESGDGCKNNKLSYLFTYYLKAHNTCIEHHHFIHGG